MRDKLDATVPRGVRYHNPTLHHIRSGYIGSSLPPPVENKIMDIKVIKE